MKSKYSNTMAIVAILLQSCTNPHIGQLDVDNILISKARTMKIHTFDLDSAVMALKFDSLYTASKEKVENSQYFAFFINSMKLEFKIINQLSDLQCGVCLSGKKQSTMFIAKHLVSHSIPEGEYCFSINDIDFKPDNIEQKSKAELATQLDTLSLVLGDGDVSHGLTTGELFHEFKMNKIKVDSKMLDSRFGFLRSTTYDWLINYEGRCQPPTANAHF